MTTGPVEPVLTSEGTVETVAVDPPSPLRSAARHWITVLLLAVLGAALGVFYAYSRPDITTAEARVGVGSGSLAAYQVAGFAQASSDLASNYARYVDLEQFQPALQKGLGAADTATIQSVAASPIPDANVIRIEVTSTSADVASRASQLVAEQLINQVKNTGSSDTPASVLKQVVTLNNQIAQAQAVYDRAQTAYAKLRNAPGGSPVSSVVSPSAAPATAADKAANQAAAAQAAADAQVATLTIQRDALKQKYQTLVNEPAAQSGLRLVSDGHAHEPLPQRGHPALGAGRAGAGAARRDRPGDRAGPSGTAPAYRGCRCGRSSRSPDRGSARGPAAVHRDTRPAHVVTATAQGARSRARMPVGARTARTPRDRVAVRVATTPAYLVCFLAWVPADMLSGNSFRLGFPISPDRLLLAAGVVLLALDARPWQAVRIRWRAVHLALALMLVFAAISAVAAGTVAFSYPVFAWLDRLFVPFLFFTLAPVVFSTSHSRDLLLKVFTFMALYLGLTSVFQIIGPNALVFPRYILDPDVGIQFDRARGPFVESEANGLVMAMTGFGAALGVTRFRGTWRSVAWLATVAAAVGVLLSLTRSVWIGTVLGALLAFVAVPRLRRWLLPAAALGAAVVYALITFVPGLGDSVFGRADAQGPLYDRLNTNAAALRIVEAHPLTGVGWLRFIDVVPEWVRQAPDYPITAINLEVHNVFLGRAAELGLLGAGLFVVCVLLGPVLAVVRRAPVGDLTGWRVVALGAFCAWVVAANSSPLSYPLPNALVWLIAGITSAGWTSSVTSRSPGRIPVPVP